MRDLSGSWPEAWERGRLETKGKSWGAKCLLPSAEAGSYNAPTPSNGRARTLRVRWDNYALRGDNAGRGLNHPCLMGRLRRKSRAHYSARNGRALGAVHKQGPKWLGTHPSVKGVARQPSREGSTREQVLPVHARGLLSHQWHPLTTGALTGRVI